MRTPAVIALTLAAAPALARPDTFAASGAAAGDILAAVDAYRAAISLGGANNGAGGGPFAIGRREINWDAPGLDPFEGAANNMPLDFFNNNSKRGALFSTPDGDGFHVSLRTADDSLRRFGDSRSEYASAFKLFSAERLFAVEGGLVTQATFRVPNEPGTLASVNGFGAVFADVDASHTTSIEFYNGAGRLIHTAYADPLDNGLSFVGVVFGTQRVATVRITTGDAILGSIDGLHSDVVVMDDFFYGEPQSVPAPGAAMALGVAALAARRRRR